MKISTTLGVVLYAAQTALAAQCNADNCARAITGTFRGFASTRGVDCSSFQLCTAAPAPSTVISTESITTASSTTTVTAGQQSAAPVSAAKREDVVERRQVTAAAQLFTACPSAIPSYASACSGSIRYSSACACGGISKTVTTVDASTITTTTTTTVTVPVATVTVAPTFNVQVAGGQYDGQLLGSPGFYLQPTTNSSQASLFTLDSVGDWQLAGDPSEDAFYAILPDGESYVGFTTNGPAHMTCVIAPDDTFTCPNSDGRDTFRICKGSLSVTTSTDPSSGDDPNSDCFGAPSVALRIVIVH